MKGFPMNYAPPSGRADIALTLRDNPQDGAERSDLVFRILEEAGAKPVDDFGDGRSVWIDLSFEGVLLTLQYTDQGYVYLSPRAGSKPDGDGYTTEEWQPVAALAARLAGPA